MAKDSRLGGRPRARINAQVRARTDHPLCPMCGHPINRLAKRTGRRHPLASVVDEWVPRSKGGPVTLANCVEMHSACNAIKSDHWPITTELRDRCTDEVERELNPGVGELTRSPW